MGNTSKHGHVREGPLFFFASLPFFTRHMADMGFSEHTARSYRKSLKLLLEFAATRGLKANTLRFQDCDRDFLYDYLEWLRDSKGCSPGTVRNRLAAIRAYAKYAVAQDVSLASCLIAIESVKWAAGPDRQPEVISKEQFELIIGQIPDSRKGFRNRIMLLILYETAIRVSELLGITAGDLHLKGSNPYIDIRGKGKKERAVPVTTELAACLKRYAAMAPGGEGDGSGRLFQSSGKDGGPLDQRTVRYILQDYADKARAKDPTIPMKIGCHCLRRSRATTLYHSGLNFESISSLLGHEQLETTRKHYARPSLEMMREAMRKAAPEFEDEEPNWLGKEKELAKLFGL